jgi:hypothetical protein
MTRVLTLDEFQREVWNSTSAPLLASDTCVLHSDKSRLPSFYRELHHVIPQAWQAFWCPPSQSRPSTRPWDARTEPCCPTGHRNVHYLLVLMMKEWQSWDIQAQEVPRIFAVKSQVTRNLRGGGYSVAPSEADMAAQAMVRWSEWGGDLNALCARKLYGYA